jgi:type IV secretion system protein VirB6/type IV secretion system protein TrbL
MYVLASSASAAHAQVDNAGVLDQALKQYRTAAEAWQSAGQGAANALFWSLATISLVWTMGQLVLRRAELGEFFGELVRYLLFTGFWAWMLNNGPAHAQLIIESMIKLAGGASGQNMMSPSGVLDVGFHLVDRALTQSSILSPFDSAIGIVLALVILVVLALVGVNMLVTLIACWIVAYGGLIVLGFGGSRWTSDMAINYYRMVLSLGLQIMAMVLLVGIGESFLRGYYDALDRNVSLHQQAVLLVVSIVLLTTVNRVPALLGTLASGSSPQYALGAGPGAGTAMSAISTAGGLAAWSSVAGKSVTDGAGKLALGAGSLANAMAAATMGGTSAAMTSLLDGFRSRGTDRAPGTAGSSGNSVLPTPATSASPSAPAAPPTPPATHQMRRADASPPPTRATTLGSIARAEIPARPAGDAAGRTPNDSPREALAQPRSNNQDGSRQKEPSARPANSDTKTGAQHTEAAVPKDPHAQRASGAAASASEPTTHSTPDSPSKAGKPEPIAPSAPRERTGAAAARSSADVAAAYSSGTISPAVAFAQPPNGGPSTPGTTAASPVPSAALPATSPTPRPAAPTSALAEALRTAAAPPNIPLSIPTSPEPPASRAPAPTAAAEPTDRAELPAAYGQQTSVDVEAEVAAFRDKD